MRPHIGGRTYAKAQYPIALEVLGNCGFSRYAFAFTGGAIPGTLWNVE